MFQRLCKQNGLDGIKVDGIVTQQDINVMIFLHKNTITIKDNKFFKDKQQISLSSAVSYALPEVTINTTKNTLETKPSSVITAIDNLFGPLNIPSINGKQTYTKENTTITIDSSF
jgi:hypothetical protein